MSRSHVTGFDPALALASMMVAYAHACAAVPVAPAHVPAPQPGATTAERRAYRRTFGRPMGDGKTKAQRDAEKAAASIGYVNGRRVGKAGA